MTENEILAGLENLDYKKELERVFNSPEYREVNRQLSVNNATFASLPDNVKLVAYYLNQRGIDTYIPDLYRYMYKRKPPTVEEYLTEAHGGPVMEKLYDGWKKVLLRDFHSSFIRQTPNELVFSG